MRVALGALAFLALAALGLWFQVAAPCEMFMFSPTADIPGRCVMP